MEEQLPLPLARSTLQSQPKYPATPLQYLAALEFAHKRQRYPNVPVASIVKPKFSDKTTNDLTKCVIRAIELHGGYAVRIQTQGQYNETLGQWTKGQTRKGTADIHAIVTNSASKLANHISIEIKAGTDRMSEAQKKTAEAVRRAGGHYLIVNCYAVFWEWFKQFAPDLVNEKGGLLL